MDEEIERSIVFFRASRGVNNETLEDIWKSTNPRWIKVNCDGSSNSISSKATIASLFWNNKGDFLHDTIL